MPPLRNRNFHASICLKRDQPASSATLRHPGLSQFRRAYISDEDEPVFLGEFRARLMQKVLPPVGYLGVNCASTLCLAGTLYSGEPFLAPPVELRDLHLLAAR